MTREGLAAVNRLGDPPLASKGDLGTAASHTKPPLGLPPPQRHADLGVGTHTTPLQFSCSFLAPESDVRTIQSV